MAAIVSHLPLASDVLPYIDVSEPLTSPSVLAAISAASSSHGFLQLRNVSQSLPPSLLSSLSSSSRAFFALPKSRKVLSSGRSPVPRGFSSVASESFSILVGESSPPDLVEKVRIGPPLCCDGLVVVGQPLLAQNIWGPGQEEADLRECMYLMHGEMSKLSERLLEAFVRALDLPFEFDPSLTTGAGEQPASRLSSSILSVNSYPPLSDVPSKLLQLSSGQHRLAPHTDVSLFTILYQGSEFLNPSRRVECGGGLEVYLPFHGGWHAADSPWVVNVGDGLEHLSRGAFRSGIHRVSLPPPPPAGGEETEGEGEEGGRPRCSAAFFVNPGADTAMDEGGTTFEEWRKKRIDYAVKVAKRADNNKGQELEEVLLPGDRTCYCCRPNAKRIWD